MARIIVKDMERILQEKLGNFADLITNYEDISNDFIDGLSDSEIMDYGDSYLYINLRDDYLTISSLEGLIDIDLSSPDNFNFDDCVYATREFKKIENYCREFDGKKINVEEFAKNLFDRLKLNLHDYDVIYESNKVTDEWLTKEY